jgi:hypothetical protein
MRQRTQRGYDTRRQRCDTTLARLGPIGPEDRHCAGGIYITPIEIDGFGHAGASAGQEQQERLDMPRRRIDQPFGLIGQQIARATRQDPRDGNPRGVAPATIGGVPQDRP